jgi:hypothetical protein
VLVGNTALRMVSAGKVTMQNGSTRTITVDTGFAAHSAEAQVLTTVALTGDPAAGGVGVRPGVTQVVTLTPSVVRPHAGGEVFTDPLTITVTVPKSLTVTQNSWVIDAVTSPSDPLTSNTSIVSGTALSPVNGYGLDLNTEDSEGNRVLRFTLGARASGTVAGVPAVYPAISFTVSAVAGAVMPTPTAQIRAVIATSGNNGQPEFVSETNLADRTDLVKFSVSALAAFGWGLTQSTDAMYPGIVANTYSVSIFDTSPTNATNVSGAVVLPFAGDTRAGIPSSVTSVQVTGLAGTVPAGAAPMTLSYTTTSGATTQAALLAVPSGANVRTATAPVVTWVQYLGGALPVDVTAVAWEIPVVRGTNPGSGGVATGDNYALTIDVDDLSVDVAGTIESQAETDEAPADEAAADTADEDTADKA